MVEMGGKFMGGLFVMQSFQLYTVACSTPPCFWVAEKTGSPSCRKFLPWWPSPCPSPYVFPRYRTEDVLRLMWKWPVLVGLMGLAVVMK